MMIPIPDRMRDLPRDARGFPIPFIVMRDRDGRPHFTINDEARRRFVLENDRCAICNFPLNRGRWYVGGPACAFHKRGAYLDPPMHRECAHYALQVCPYLAAPRYAKLIDGRTLDPAKAPSLVLLDSNVDNSRPALFVAVMAIGHKIVMPEGYTRPRRPLRRIEFWQHGRQISREQAEPLLAEDHERWSETRKRRR
jgi:hypothetical protein